MFLQPKIRLKIPQSSRLSYLAIFAIGAVVFTFLHWERSLMDPDSFYHMKIVMLMIRDGVIRDFTWLPFTSLASAFADHHFLYHLALVPFVALLGPVIGIKTATVIFAAGAMTAFYAVLRAYRVRFSFLLTVILITSGGFIFRLALAKATALSLLFIFLALLAIRHERRRTLFILSWLFVWLYGGWPLLFVITGAFLAGRVMAEALVERQEQAAPWALRIWRRLAAARREERFWAWPETRNLLAVGAGLSAGLVINPFFPRNLAFYWEQIVQIAVVNYGSAFVVGNEWYPYTFAELFGRVSTIFIILAVILTILLTAVFWGGQQQRLPPFEKKWLTAFNAIFLLAVFFMLLTLRSRRHIEYFAPFAVFFEGLLLTAILPLFGPSELRSPDGRRSKSGLAGLALVVYLSIFLPLIAVRDVVAIGGVYRKSGIPLTKYAGAAGWLSANTPEGSIIFHSDWDDFPVLFFHDDRNRYINGLDPTFLYRQDPVRFREYVDITTGKRQLRVGRVIARLFRSGFVLVENDHGAMLRAAEADRSLHKVYEDKEATIFSTPGL